MIHRRSCCFPLCLLALQAIAQSFVIREDILDVHRGLSNNNVSSLQWEDTNRVWIATQDGLNLFDGYQVHEFNKASTNLTSDNIQKVFKTHKGEIAVITQTESIPIIMKDLYVAQSDGDYLFQPRPGFRNRPFQNVSFLSDPYDALIYALTSNPDKLWLYDLDLDVWSEVHMPESFRPQGFVDGYVFSSDGSELRFERCYPPHTETGARPDTLDSPHATWIRRLYPFISREIQSLYRYSTYTCLDTIHHILWAMNDNNQLIGWDASGHRVHFQGGETVYPLPYIIAELKFSPMHLLEVLTTGGLYELKIQPQWFSAFYLPTTDINKNNPNRHSCRGVTVYDGQLYANEEIYFFRQSLSDPSDYNLISSLPFHISPVIRDGQSILLGRQDVLRYWPDGRSDKLETLATFPDTIFIWSLLRKGHKLYVGHSNGISVLDMDGLERGEIKTICQVEPDQRLLFVYQIIAGAHDRMYYLTSDGLYVDAKDDCHLNRIHFQLQNGREAGFSGFAHMHIGRDSLWWVATLDGGVSLISLKDTVAHIVHSLDRRNGLPTNTTYAVYPDGHGSVWISTNLGLIQLFEDDWSYRMYTTDDGLPNDEFNRISHYQDENGHLYFGGLSGIVRVIPEEFPPQAEVNSGLRILQVNIFSSWKDSLLVYNPEMVLNQRIIFRPGDRFLRIAVGLDELFRSNLHQFEYKLVGIHDDWEMMTGNLLTLNILPYGNHTLQIRGRNADGMYSRNIAQLSIWVKRPFYLQWWFYLMMSFGVFLMLREIFLGRTRRMLWRANALENQVRLRTETISAQAEELRELHQMRSRFFANISHELRTPLTLIKGPVDRLLRAIQDPDQKKWLEIIRNHANKLHERIDDLLNLSRADADQLTAQNNTLHLNSFLEQLTGIFQASANDKQVKIELVNTLPANLLIATDMKKLEQILSNYLSNAIRFSPSRGIITLHCTIVGKNIVFSVNDEGPGIRPEETEKVFERFYTTGNNDRMEGGVGIGLALSKEFAQTLSGQVWVESEVGKGSTFFLQLPYHAAEGEAISHVEFRDDTDVSGQVFPLVLNKSTGEFTIQIVEDNPAMRAFLVEELQQFKTITAQNGQDALEKLIVLRHKNQLPDLILSDVMMPEMDGFDLLNRIRTMDQIAEIPVILLTARAGLEDRLKALRIGVDDYIAKPFHSEELILRIKYLLSRWPERRAERTEPQDVSAFDANWLSQLEHTVRSHISDSQYTLLQLAEEVHISERQLRRRIKSLTGLTPNKYILEVRLFEAKALLESGEMDTVALLSSAVGFEDPDYFSRRFLERFGFRPSQRL